MRNARSPFQVGLAWQPSRPPITAGEVRLRTFPGVRDRQGLPVVPSSTDVSVTVAERGTELHCSVEYRVAAIDGRAAREFVQDSLPPAGSTAGRT